MIRTHYASQLSAEMDGEEVTLVGWVHEVRVTSNITFLVLRDGAGMVQLIGKRGETSDEIIERMSLPKESVISVTGRIKANKEAKRGFEVVPSSITNLNPLSKSIPFDVTGKVPADIDTRLNHRYIDLRREGPAAIFRIQSTIIGTFVSFFAKRGFVQIRTPSIIAEASEGGSELFQVKYFERDAYLAQSPQLYKQLAIIGGFEKVAMVVPVFRAEKSNTVYHTTELTQMDIEIGFADDKDAIGLLSKCFIAILKEVKKRNKSDLEILGAELSVPKVKIVTYSNVIKKLKAKGHQIEFGHDISKEHEKSLEEMFGEAVMVRDFPASVRAFYSMPKEGNPELTNSFDLIYRGFEISSGAQRIHQPDMLVESLKRKGLNPQNFEFYIDAFRCGAPPHAGWSIGLERLTMCITKSANIREASLFPRDRKRLTP